MGIDIYLEWDGQTEEDKTVMVGAGILGNPTDGDVGYLREAYHGGPYATQIIFREAFESDDCRAEIPADLMAERMTSVTEPANQKDCNNGHFVSAILQGVFGGKREIDMENMLSAEEKEEVASSDDPDLSAQKVIAGRLSELDVEGVIKEMTHRSAPVTEPMTGEEAIRLRMRTVYNASSVQIEETIKEFYAFIRTAREKEQEQGKPCTVYASY